MKTTAKRGAVILLLVALVVGGLGLLGYRFTVNGEKWATMRANEHLSEKGNFIGAGNVLDRNGEVLAYTEGNERKYSSSERVRRSTIHIVGDTQGYIASGVQTAYKSQLAGYSKINGMYTLERYGKGNDVVLTIDSKVNVSALDALGNRKGVVAAYNYKTGELLCSVSSPNFDVENKPTSEEIDKNEDGKYEGLYLNRLIDGLYTPGSTFKIVTAVSAIQNVTDIDSFEYTCEGEIVVGGVKITCPNKHGTMNFQESFTNSCNCAFAILSQKIGGQQLEATAHQVGFGKEFRFGNRYTKESLVSLAQASEGDVAWASVGQYETLVNPYHMLTLLGAVANDGNAVLPYVVSSVTTPTGKEIQKNTALTESYLAAEVSRKIKEIMRKTVENNYGDYNFQGLSMCGKTGTAEVDDNHEPHSWFVGFSQNEKCPVAIVVVVENGGWGSSAALPIASGVMRDIYKSLS